MNKNILKVFGFAALLALGVQTANAAVTRYYGWISCEAVGDGLVATPGTSYPNYESDYKTKATGGKTKEYAEEPGAIVDGKYGTWTYVAVSPKTADVLFLGFFTDAACMTPLSSDVYSLAAQGQVKGAIVGDIYKVYIPSSSAAGASAPAEEFQTKIYAKFAKPVSVQTVATSAELSTAIEGGNTSIKIESGATLTIAKGENVTIPSGTTLTVDGTLEILGSIDNKGVINGSGLLTGNFCAVQQESTVQIPYPYGTDSVTAGKYVKTTSQSLNLGAVDAGVSQKWSVTVATGSGTELKSELLEGVPAAVVCTVDKTTALNKITAIDGIYADVPSAIEAAQYAENYQDNDKLVVLVKDTPALYDSPAYQSPNALRKGFAIDCAGNTAYFYGNQFGSKYLIRFFNGPVTLWSKLMRTHVNFYGCSKVNVLSVAVKYNTEVSLYDIAVSHNSEGTSNVQIGYLEETGDEELLDEEASYVRYFGGGIYDAFPKSMTAVENLKAYVTPVVYWGTFAEDPTEYLADKEKFEGKLLESGEYLVVEKSAKKPETKVVVPDESEIKPVDEEGKEITGDDATKAVEAAKTAVEAIAGNTGAEMTEGTGVEAAVFTSGEEVKAEVAQGLNEQAKNVTKDDKGAALSQSEQQEVQAKVAAITESKDLSSYVKVDVKSPVVEVKESVATVKTLVYDVQPMAVTKVTTTVDSANPKTVTVEAPVVYNDAANPITFRLPLTDAFTVSAIVTHEGDPDRLCMVQGAAGSRYIELSASHFSLFTATPSDVIEATAGSKTILGIKRVDYTVTQKTDDLAAAVPWLKAADTDMPVSKLITTGLTSGDQIQVYDLAAKTYYSWHWNGTSWEADKLSNGDSVPSADSYVLKRGSAFWFKPGVKAGTYTQVGLYSDTAITTKVNNVHSDGTAASFANPVHNLMASPKYAEFSIKEKLTVAAGCANDDVVVIVATGVRYRFNGSVWGQDKTVEKTSKFDKKTYTTSEFVPTDGDILVPAGTAFWYLSAGGAPEFEW